MLIRFNIKNFLSFDTNEDGKSEEFSMIAGKVRNKKEHTGDDGNLRLLKFAAVFGANASGKSNLVKAMEFMRSTVIDGLPDGYTEKYCKTNIDNKEKPSYFELEIKLKEKYYAYGFEILLSRGEFCAEWLVELTADNKERLIFSREISAGVYEFGGLLNTKGLREKMDVYAEDVQDDNSVLFLSVMNHNKRTLYEKYKRASILQEVYLWIDRSLDINYPNEPISNYSYMADTKNVREVCNLIEAFGTGITGFKMVDVSIEKVLSHLPRSVQEDVLRKIENLTTNAHKKQEKHLKGLIMRSPRDFFVLEIKEGNVVCQTIQFSHNKKETLYEMSEESDGTVRILDLLEILLSDEGKTYVIDELDRCLHPSLTYKFVDSYLQMVAKKNIQLIVTTHESRLLDFDLLRRDEIWFVNKRGSGESDIYSLEEYNARFDQKIDKAYLEGRYGGVPIFSTVFPIKEV